MRDTFSPHRTLEKTPEAARLRYARAIVRDTTGALIIAQALRARHTSRVRDRCGGYFLFLLLVVGEELERRAVLIVTTPRDLQGLVVEVVLPAQGVVSVDTQHRH